jgi:hypothetical protein
MAAVTLNDKIKRGDSAVYDIACAFSLVGATLRLCAKLALSDADAAALVRIDSAGLGGIVITDAGNGLAVATIAPGNFASLGADTVLFFDLQATEADGTVTTLVEGTLFVTLDVTQAS